MFEGYFADMCTAKCMMLLMGGQVDGRACEDPGMRTRREAREGKSSSKICSMQSLCAALTRYRQGARLIE
jgi:hypothetical protein